MAARLLHPCMVLPQQAACSPSCSTLQQAAAATVPAPPAPQCSQHPSVPCTPRAPCTPVCNAPLCAPCTPVCYTCLCAVHPHPICILLCTLHPHGPPCPQAPYCVLRVLGLPANSLGQFRARGVGRQVLTGHSRTPDLVLLWASVCMPQTCRKSTKPCTWHPPKETATAGTYTERAAQPCALRGARLTALSLSRRKSSSVRAASTSEATGWATACRQRRGLGRVLESTAPPRPVHCCGKGKPCTSVMSTVPSASTPSPEPSSPSPSWSSISSIGLCTKCCAQRTSTRCPEAPRRPEDLLAGCCRVPGGCEPVSDCCVTEPRTAVSRARGCAPLCLHSPQLRGGRWWAAPALLTPSPGFSLSPRRSVPGWAQSICSSTREESIRTLDLKTQQGFQTSRPGYPPCLAGNKSSR